MIYIRVPYKLMAVECIVINDRFPFEYIIGKSVERVERNALYIGPDSDTLYVCAENDAIMLSTVPKNLDEDYNGLSDLAGKKILNVSKRYLSSSDEEKDLPILVRLGVQDKNGGLDVYELYSCEGSDVCCISLAELQEYSKKNPLF
jgi:hypothetical protein